MPYSVFKSGYFLTIFLGDLKDESRETSDRYRVLVLERLRNWAQKRNTSRRLSQAIDVWPKGAGFATIIKITVKDSAPLDSWRMVKREVKAILKSAAKEGGS